MLRAFIPLAVQAQPFFRMKADFSIKQKNAEGKGQLIMGTVYYDKTAKTIVYNITFPEKETWITTDSATVKVVNGKVVKKQTVPFMTQFSIFHICLNGNLQNYGLEGSYYTLESVEKENGMVISTWQPDAKLKGAFGKVLMSVKDKQLYGIVFFNANGKVVSKQFYSSYQNMHGFMFPGEITGIGYSDKGEQYKMTTYKNIVVDDMGEDNMYHYKLPD